MKTNRIRLILVLFFSITYIELSSQISLETLNPKPSYMAGKDIHFISDTEGFYITSTEIFYTSDSGVTWTKKRNIQFGNDINFYGSLGFVVGNAGRVYKSIDSGDTWQQINVGVNENFNTVNIIDENKIILSSSNKLLKSFDAGMNWEIINITQASVKKTFFINESIGHAACSNGTILKTIDGGNNWYITEETSTSPSDYIYIHFVNENIGFASRKHNYIFKTIDGGESWFVIYDGIFSILSIHFLNELDGFASGENGIALKTTNGGQSWSSLNILSGFPAYSDFNSIFFVNQNKGFVVGERGRVVRTTNGGNSWNHYAVTYQDIKQLQFVNNNMGYFMINEQDFYKTTNAGESWQYVGRPNHYEFSSGFDFVNENIGYSSGGGGSSASGSVYKTVNGGVTWVKTNNGNNVHNYEGLYSIDFIDENIGFVSGGFNQKRLYKTTNGGNTWENIGNYSFTKMHFFNSLIGYGMRRYYESLYKTTDGGLTWQVVLEADEDINDMYFINEDIIYVAGYAGLILKSSDGGANWQDVQTPPGHFGMVYDNILFYDEEHGLLSNDHGELFVTYNGGDDWIYVGDFNTIIDIQRVNNRIYLNGEYGLILRIVFDELDIDENENSNYNVLVYPNPVRDKINISYSGKENINLIEVIDLTGKSVFKYSNDSADNLISIEIPDNIQGMFLMKIILDENFIVFKKIIVK